MIHKHSYKVESVTTRIVPHLARYILESIIFMCLVIRTLAAKVNYVGSNTFRVKRQSDSGHYTAEVSQTPGLIRLER